MDNERNATKTQALSPAISALMAFTLIGIGACGFEPVTNELKTGKAYTLAVMFGQGSKVHRDTSPEAYWINIGWQTLGFAIGIILGISILYQIYRSPNQKSKK
jgi:hypothetical protein